MFGPQPTEEEWKVWCKQNKQLWDSEYWLKRINKVTDAVDTPCRRMESKNVQ